MDPSEPSGGNISEIPNHRWAKILGNLIAVMTLVLPLIAIASNSSISFNENLSPVNYYQPIQGK